MNTETNLAVKTSQEPRRFVKRIGSTNYRVNVHFSQTSKETMNDKIIRLVKSESKAVNQ